MNEWETEIGDNKMNAIILNWEYDWNPEILEKNKNDNSMQLRLRKTYLSAKYLFL